MAQPRDYNRNFNFNDFQTTNPSDPLPATQVDTEFNSVKLTLDDLNTNIGLIQRDDGKLSNASVHKEALSQDALALITAGNLTPKGNWAATTSYVAADIVNFNDATYLATVAHTAASAFATDLAAGNWILIANAAIAGTASAVDKFEGTGSQTAFTLTYTYTGNTDVQVYVNGALRNPGDDYSISGNTLTFVTAPSTPAVSGNENVIVWGTSVVVEPAKSAAQAASSNASGFSTLAQDWAEKTTGPVTGTSYSSKYWATSTPVTTVSTNIADVTTVAGQISPTNNISTVASRDADIGTVAARDANIGTVASRDADIGTVASRDADIGTVAARDANIGVVAARDANIGTVAARDTDIGTLASISTDVTTLANALSATTTYTVTVAGGVFVLDSSPNPALTFDRGNTYIFDLSDSSNSGHPLVFKNGSAAYTVGVTTTGTAGTAGAKVTIVVDAAAPSSGLLYACSVHGNGMGNTIATVTSNFAVVASNMGNINTVAGANTNITSVATSIANVNSVAGTLAAVTSFANLFEAGTNAPSSPSSGDLWYDTTNAQLNIYVNSSWQLVGSYLQGLTTTHVFTATGSQTTFTTDDASQTMSIHANGNTLVFKNGIRLVEGSSTTNDYYISGNNVVLNAGATAGDVLYVEVFTKISTTQEASLNALVALAQSHKNDAETAKTAAETAQTASETAKTASESARDDSIAAKNDSVTARTAAQTAQTAAEAAWDSLDDRYLGAKSSAPTVDNDGNALLTGSIYWNSTSSTLQVWDGSAWQQGAFTAGSLLANVVEDTTPVLGGSLDVGAHSIVSASNQDIAITPNGTGNVVLDGLNYPQADGTSGQFLQTDGSGQLSFATVSTPSLSSLGIANHDNLSVDSSGNVALGASSIAFGTSKWTIVLDGNDLDFQYNGTTVFKLASNGAVTSADNITAYGSP